MELVYDYRQHYQHHHDTDQTSSCCTSSFPSRMSVVQSLNNRACVQIAIGNFSKANHLFETALTKHKEMASDASDNHAIDGSTCTGTDSICRNCRIAYNRGDNEGMDICDGFVGDYEESSESSFECDEDDFSLIMGNGDDASIHYDQQHQRGNSAYISSATPYRPPSSHNGYSLSLSTRSVPPADFRRMRCCSDVLTFSYSGQQSNRSALQWMHHKVYSLPVVMNEREWEEATMDDRSFVLIFNSAMCNHLWGMKMMANHQMQPKHHGTVAPDPLPYERPFMIAKMLYQLALEHVSISGTGGILGVDRLCYPAVFNNLSHLCKTFEGYNSYEAYQYDTLLLKSVYWLIDSASPNHPSANVTTQTLPSNSINNNGSIAADLAQLSAAMHQHHIDSYGNNENNDDHCYEENDEEVIDGFLENVFYLIGVPQAIVPAAAA